MKARINRFDDQTYVFPILAAIIIQAKPLQY